MSHRRLSRRSSTAETGHEESQPQKTAASTAAATAIAAATATAPATAIASVTARITIPYEEQRLPHPTGTGDASIFSLSTGVWVREGHDAPVWAPARPARLSLKKQMLL